MKWGRGWLSLQPSGKLLGEEFPQPQGQANRHLPRSRTVKLLPELRSRKDSCSAGCSLCSGFSGLPRGKPYEIWNLLWGKMLWGKSKVLLVTTNIITLTGKPLGRNGNWSHPSLSSRQAWAWVHVWSECKNTTAPSLKNTDSTQEWPATPEQVHGDSMLNEGVSDSQKRFLFIHFRHVENRSKTKRSTSYSQFQLTTTKRTASAENQGRSWNK